MRRQRDWFDVFYYIFMILTVPLIVILGSVLLLGTWYLVIWGLVDLFKYIIS